MTEGEGAAGNEQLPEPQAASADIQVIMTRFIVVPPRSLFEIFARFQA